MSERFFVDTVNGWLTPPTGRAHVTPHLTAVVFDRLVNCRNVAQYRSEDENNGHRTKQEMLGRAYLKAHEHARRLNEDAVLCG